MGLMDKVKAQATVLAQKTQETAREGKARLDQVQANKHADALLRNLGALVYAERTNRGAPDTQDQITKLVGEISAHEAENGINLSSQPAGYTGPGVPAQGTPGGPAGPGSTPFADPGSSSFPQSGSTFPESGGGATSFPDSGSGTGFPPEAGSSPGI
jgi:hypothetical protein